jgi:competence protein ComEA
MRRNVTLARALRVAVLSVGLCAWALPRAQASDTDTTTPAPTTQGVVNLNAASAEELERLPGIGPSRAQAILALRTQLTRFTRLEQLLRVKGIGRATFRKLRPLLTLEGETTLSDKRRTTR